jgi:hypothetical protein
VSRSVTVHRQPTFDQAQRLVALFRIANIGA